MIRCESGEILGEMGGVRKSCRCGLEGQPSFFTSRRLPSQPLSFSSSLHRDRTLIESFILEAPRLFLVVMISGITPCSSASSLEAFAPRSSACGPCRSPPRAYKGLPSWSTPTHAVSDGYFAPVPSLVGSPSSSPEPDEAVDFAFEYAPRLSSARLQ